MQYEQVNSFIDSVSGLINMLQNYSPTPRAYKRGDLIPVCDMGDYAYYWNGYALLKRSENYTYRYDPSSDVMIEDSTTSKLSHKDPVARSIWEDCKNRAM